MIIISRQEFEDIKSKIKKAINVNENNTTVKHFSYNKNKVCQFNIEERYCDNKIWKENVLISVNGSNYEDKSGYGCPYLREDFIALAYEELPLPIKPEQFKELQMDMFEVMK